MTSGTLVPLPALIDLALGTPEIGAVNFNVLHSLLHVIVQQTKLYETQVEFKGSDADRLETLVKSTTPRPSVKLQAYQLPVISAKKSPDKEESTVSTEGPHEEDHRSETELQTVVLVESFETEETPEVERKTSKTGSHRSSKRAEDRKSGDHGVIVKKGSFERLERKVSKLQSEMQKLGALPTTEDLIRRSRASSDTTPVTDMWHILNLTKRMDAAEEGIEKLTSVLEDMAKQAGFAGLAAEFETSEMFGKSSSSSSPFDIKDSKDIVERLINVEKRLWDVEHRLSTSDQRLRSSWSGSDQAGREPPSYEGMSLEETVTTVRGELDSLVQELRQHLAATENIPFDVLAEGMKLLEDLQRKVEAHDEQLGGSYQPCSRVKDLEERIATNANMIQNMELSFSSQVENLQLQIGDLEKEMGIFMERMNADEVMQESSLQDLSGLTELYNKIQTLQNEMDNVNNTTAQLMDDREERQIHINALLEQIELLKTVKADREDLEDALAEKADHTAVNRKVSHDQFDAACNDLSTGLEDALGKLNEQKKLWEEALNDVQHEIENKLDRIEISSLVDFVNAKLKNLHERLQALAAIRKDIEAAGIKRKILRDVKCISCDKDVVMKIDNELPSAPTKGAMPPSRSVRPYLTYELDLVRKQQKRLPVGRSMIHYEEAMLEAKTKGKAEMQPHICNRYCGGSHTITTAQQRVSRVGHFLEQWGPEAIQLLEGGVKGTDGRIYKARGKAGSPGASPTMVSTTTSPMKFTAEGLPDVPPPETRSSALEIVQGSLHEVLLKAETLDAGEPTEEKVSAAVEEHEDLEKTTAGTSSHRVAARVLSELIYGSYPSQQALGDASGGEAPGPSEPTPAEESTPGAEPTPTEEPTPSEEPTPTEEPTPGEEATPGEEPTPGEEATPGEEPTPSEEPAPAVEEQVPEAGDEAAPDVEATETATE